MKTLHLVLKRKWWDMIESGIKTEEYREIKPYWEKRLLDYKAIFPETAIDAKQFLEEYFKIDLTI